MGLIGEYTDGGFGGFSIYIIQENIMVYLKEVTVVFFKSFKIYLWFINLSVPSRYMSRA